MRAPTVLLAAAVLAVLPAAAGAAPAVGASSAVLMDAEGGRVLYAVAPTVRRPPASTTKLLTALLVAESLARDTPVLISERAAAERSGSAIGLEAGERWTADQLMRAMLIHSANDAAVALAEAVAGSVDGFAQQMNARAGALGASDSSFVTPHGRFHAQHYTTARDLALIAREALRAPWIDEIVRSQTWELQRNGTSRLLINTNRLLWLFPGADGAKTGWIAESGPCLVASATRDGWRLIAVVLNGPQMYEDVTRLLDYGFGAFTRTRAVGAGEIVHSGSVRNGLRPLVAVAAAEGVVVAPKGATIARQLHLVRTAAPIARGEAVGTLILTSGRTEVGRVPLVARDAVPRRSVVGRLWQWMRGFVTKDR